MSAAPWYYEAKIAHRSGVTRDELKQLRAGLLKKKTDWKMHGRHVVISQNALARIREHLGISAALDFTDCATQSQKNGTAHLELVVKRLYPNPRLLSALPAGADEEVRVKVPDNRNFRPGMTLRASPPADPPAPQLYRLVGRCPRFPGRW